jgi:hypothetical protein
VPAIQFGLFAEQTGIWDTSVQLGSAPDAASASVGFAASVNASGNCPPGLTKMIFWKVTVVTNDITPTHNFPSGSLVSTEVNPTTSTPAAFNIVKYGQGDCNNTTCTMPISFAGNAKADQAYSSAGQTAFCVIPASSIQ